MYIVHLSDLHFGTKNDANNWYNQLYTDLHEELKCSSLDALVLSGDIVSNSTPEEYEAAREFIMNLMIDFRLRRSEVVIVPGNHDLNVEKAEEAYTLKDRQKCTSQELEEGHYIKVSEDVVRVRDEEQYKQRFTYFSKFHETVLKRLYPLDSEHQYTLHHFPDHDLLILGLNSAWQLDHQYTSRASINPHALSNAMTEINYNYTYKNSHLKIAVWHHPLKSPFEDRITDHGFMEQLAQNGFRLALHGHIHRAEKEDFKYRPEKQIDIIAAGTFGAPVRDWVPDYPRQYNLLKWEGNKLTVYTRKRKELYGAWQVDAMCPQDILTALSHYEIELWKPKKPELKNGKTLQKVAFKPPSPEQLDVEYKNLLEAISNGEVVPFVGAGINLCDRPKEMGSWQLDSQYPPTDSELAAYLTNIVHTPYDEIIPIKCPFYANHLHEPKRSSSENPVLICPLFTEQKVMLEEIALQRLSQYADLREATSLYNTLRAIFRRNYSPNKLHRFLVDLVGIMDKKNDRYPLLVTANFDNALENAFREARKEFDLVSYIAKPQSNGQGDGFIHQTPKGKVQTIRDPNKYTDENGSPLLKKRPVILKLYGGLERTDSQRRKGFVITEDHYIDYLAHRDISQLLPSNLLNTLRQSEILFLGYSLRYWNHRVILHRLWPEAQFPNIYGWAIHSSPGIMESALWERRSTMFLNMFLEDYISGLNKRLQPT
ncbi:MAG: SIR2 family protein [Xenococcaceae cyanobacterium MO_207.B15]|nr:SIR2 family protein [Xenococcaceae cyanobacterium MO_207.B15]